MLPVPGIALVMRRRLRTGGLRGVTCGHSRDLARRRHRPWVALATGRVGHHNCYLD
jgi:hypothetical protein